MSVTMMGTNMKLKIRDID